MPLVDLLRSTPFVEKNGGSVPCEHNAGTSSTSRRVHCNRVTFFTAVYSAGRRKGGLIVEIICMLAKQVASSVLQDLCHIRVQTTGVNILECSLWC